METEIGIAAERFAADGADVVVCSREQAKVDEVADGIDASDRPGDCLAVECDVRERDSVEALVDAAVEEFGTGETVEAKGVPDIEESPEV